MIRANHLGDWGTQFGMLTQHMLDTRHRAPARLRALGLLYREAKHRFDSEPEFADAARRRVVALQSGDPRRSRAGRTWSTSRSLHINDIYAELDITLGDEHVVGESFYNPRLEARSSALLDARRRDREPGRDRRRVGALHQPGRHPAVLIIRKSDGGYGYGATDLAAIRYRAAELHADRMIYVTDARQAQHFAMVFDAGRRRVARTTRAPSTSRSARCSARTASRSRPARAERSRCRPARGGGRPRPRGVDEKSPELPDAERAEIAQRRRHRRGQVRGPVHEPPARPRVQLRPHARARRQHRARTCSTPRSAPARSRPGRGRPPTAVTALERPRRARPGAEARRLLRCASTTSPPRSSHTASAPTSTSSRAAFTTFYDACPVLKAPEPERSSRLGLCRLTGVTLTTGLSLLGIRVPSRM